MGTQKESEMAEDNSTNVVEIASIPTQNYKEVIEIRVPVRFYWNPDGSFDGIEFGEFKTELLPWQEYMMNQCLEVVGKVIEEADEGA